jgi:hypothetical protein
MKPETTKPETAKPEKRKLKGMEAAQAALLLVLGIVIALVLYFVVIGMISSTPVPNVQVDSYNSYIAGNTATLVLKFGKSASVKSVVILGQSGTPITQSCSFPSGASSPMPVTAGQEYTFTCTLNQGASWQTNMIVRVTFADGSTANVRWVTG